MAQVVAHLIGSEEVTGPSPVISLTNPQYLLGVFVFVLHSVLHLGLKIAVYQLIYFLAIFGKRLDINLFHDMIRLPSSAFLRILIRNAEQGHNRVIDMSEIVEGHVGKTIFF